MKPKVIMLAGVAVVLFITLFSSLWLYDNHQDLQLYHRTVIYGYEDTLEDYEYLLTLQRDIINEENEEFQARLLELYEELSFELNPQNNTGELLKLTYVQNNPDSVIADYHFLNISTPFALALREGETEEEWMAASNNFEEAIEQMRKELAIIKAELDLPTDEA